MAKYFIDGDAGSDVANGTTTTTPWKTLTKFKNSTPASGDIVVMMGNIYEPTGVVLNFAGLSNITLRQWVPSDGYPTGGSAQAPGIARAVIWGAQPLANIASGGWSTAGAAGRRQLTLTGSTALKVLVWRYGSSKDSLGRHFGHFTPCTSSGAAATGVTGVYDSASNAAGSLDGFFQTGTTLTIDSTFIGTPTTADFIVGYDLTTPPVAIQNANGCIVQGIEFRIASEKTNGAYAISFQDCANTYAYDCVAYDAGHHAFGISNGGTGGRNCGFVRCVSMGLIGIDGANTSIRGGFAVSNANIASRQDGAYITDCEAHVYAPLSPQINATTALPYAMYRTLGSYAGVPSRGATMFGTGIISDTANTTADACSNIVFSRCLFRMYRDTLGSGVSVNSFAYGGSNKNGYPQPSDAANAENYPQRFYDCTFVDAPQIVNNTVRNTAFVRCNILMSGVEYNDQGSAGAFQIANVPAGGASDWYTLFENCNIVCSLYHPTATRYLIFHNGGGAAQSLFWRLRFQNCRVSIVGQRNATSARNETICYPGPNAGVAQAYVTFAGCIIGFENPAPTNVTNELMVSEGASSYSGSRLVFSGNVYRNISTGQFGHDTLTTQANFLNTSTGADTTGWHDVGTSDGFNLLSWGGPLGGSTNQYGVVASTTSAASSRSGNGIGGNQSSGTAGPWQFGPPPANQLRGRGG